MDLVLVEQSEGRGQEPEVTIRAREDKFLRPDLPLEGRPVFLVSTLVSPEVPLAGVLAVAEGTDVAGRNLVSLYFALRRPEVFSLLVNLQVFPSPECFITEIAVRPVRLQVSLEGAWLERFLTKLTDKSLGRPATVIFVQVRVAEIFRQKSRDLRTEVALINQI